MFERMNQGMRGVGAALATALLVAVLGLGAFGARSGFAQDSTPSAGEAEAGTADATTQTDDTTREEAAAAAYDEFVAGLAANLGVDAATVDAAIAATFTDMVAAKLAAGEISADEAAALTERIAAGELPLGLGRLDGGRGGFGGPGRMGGDHGGRGDRDAANDGDAGSVADDADGVGGATEELEPAGTPVAVI